MEIPLFTFHVVKSANYEEVLNLFWNHFMPWEPATRLTGCCTRPGYRIYNLDSMLRRMLKDNTCWMAKHINNEIVGVIFCTEFIKEDLPHKIPTKTEYLHQGWPIDFTNILLLLDQLCDHQKLMCDKKVNWMLDIFALVVKTNFRGQRIATQLIKTAVNNAKTMGVPLVSISCTSTFSQKCSINLGFNVENTILYKNWQCDGQNVFNEENIDPVHKGAISFYKIINL
jgi:GNAT superfamily N-acetyltransferase